MGFRKEIVDNRIVVLVGKSGSGKDTVVKKLAERNSDLFKAVSTTTRPQRESEVDGEDYYFVTQDQFMDRIQNNEFWEYIVYHAYKKDKIEDWYYGLGKENPLDTQNCVVVADLERIPQLIDIFGRRVIVICLDVDEEERMRRAKLRDSNFNELEWTRRVLDENKKFKWVEDKVDFVISNNDLETCLYYIEYLYK